MRRQICFAIACTGVLLAAAPDAQAQRTFRETGSVTVGGYLLWVRGTNAKVIELYVGRGFRDAFAKPHDMDAARVQQWIDSVRSVSSVPADDSSSADAQLRGTSLGADVTMLRRTGGAFSGLRLLVSGEEPIRMAEPTARDFLAILDSAARVTRELSAPPPSMLASTPVVAGTPAQPVAQAAPVAQPAPVTQPVPDTVVPPRVEVPSDKLIRTPLGPFTIPGALLSDRDKQAQYCYTQLGLKYNPDLKGEITVKLSLRSDGAVQDAVVTRRTWQGISAGEVESCVRALAHDWTFASTDPTITEGSKVVTFSFAP